MQSTNTEFKATEIKGCSFTTDAQIVQFEGDEDYYYMVRLGLDWIQVAKFAPDHLVIQTLEKHGQLVKKSLSSEELEQAEQWRNAQIDEFSQALAEREAKTVLDS